MVICIRCENILQQITFKQLDHCLSAGNPVAIGDTISIPGVGIVQVCASSKQGPVFYTLTEESGQRAIGTNQFR